MADEYASDKDRRNSLPPLSSNQMQVRRFSGHVESPKIRDARGSRRHEGEVKIDTARDSVPQ